MAGDERPQSVAFDYIKSNFFRVIRADGAVGGLNPQGVIQIALYSERMPIPKRTVNKIDAAGHLGEEILQERVIRDGLVREVEAEVMMGVDAAKQLYIWLGRQLEMAEKVREA